MKVENIYLVYVIHNASTGDLYYDAFENQDEANELACKFNKTYQNNSFQKNCYWNVLPLKVRSR